MPNGACIRIGIEGRIEKKDALSNWGPQLVKQRCWGPTSDGSKSLTGSARVHVGFAHSL